MASSTVWKTIPWTLLLLFSSDVTRLDEPGFERYVRRTLQEAKGKGVRGLKFWKDLSLSHRDKSGKYIALDDPRLQVIWAAAAELGLVVLHHVADPVAFFKPVDRYNERFEELARVPEWSFYRPGLYTFEQLMEQQEAMIRDNPTTPLSLPMGALQRKLGRCQWLDQYRFMYIDIAAASMSLGGTLYGQALLNGIRTAFCLADATAGYLQLSALF